MKKSFLELLEGYERGELSREEMKVFFAQVELPENKHLLEQAIDDKINDEEFSYSDKPEHVEKSLISLRKAIDSQVENIVVRKSFVQRYWWLAACIIASLAVLFFQVQPSPQEPVETAGSQPQEILPGKDGAILQLADGSSIVLDSQRNGLVTTQNGAALLLSNGQLTYDQKKISSGDPAMNIVSTPKGRQFKVVLPDGTIVWLNASSSVKFPAAFVGSDRRVSITGEVYLEVARDEAKPFLVNVEQEYMIEVLGTQFNVNAYTNETSIRTTLEEGKVRLTTGAGNETFLLPAQEAASQRATLQTENPVVTTADVGKATAWKNGIFNFEGVALKELMRQVERWYDVDVKYEGDVPEIQFFGKVSRNISLNGLLKGLKGAEVKFRLEGNQLIVGK